MRLIFAERRRVAVFDPGARESLDTEGEEGATPPRETGSVGVECILVMLPRLDGVEFEGKMKLELPPSSKAVLEERSIVEPVLLMSLRRRKLRSVVPLMPSAATTPGVVERTVRRLLASVPFKVRSPDTLKVLPEVSERVSRPLTSCLKKLTTLFTPLMVCARPFKVAVPLTVPIRNVVPLNVALPSMVPLFEAVLLKTVLIPLPTVVLFCEVLLKMRFVMSTLSPPLIVPEILPPQIILLERVKVPADAVLKYALPVMVPVLYAVPLKVTLPVMLVVFTVLLAKIIPTVLAGPVRPVESIETGRTEVEVPTIGETEPTRIASLVDPGTLSMFIEQELVVYQLLILFQFESAVPHQ